VEKIVTRTEEVTYYADPYRPMLLIDLKSSVIFGMAVAMMVSSYPKKD